MCKRHLLVALLVEFANANTTQKDTIGPISITNLIIGASLPAVIQITQLGSFYFIADVQTQSERTHKRCTRNVSQFEMEYIKQVK